MVHRFVLHGGRKAKKMFWSVSGYFKENLLFYKVTVSLSTQFYRVKMGTVALYCIGNVKLQSYTNHSKSHYR